MHFLLPLKMQPELFLNCFLPTFISVSDWCTLLLLHKSLVFHFIATVNRNKLQGFIIIIPIFLRTQDKLSNLETIHVTGVNLPGTHQRLQNDCFDRLKKQKPLHILLFIFYWLSYWIKFSNEVWQVNTLCCAKLHFPSILYIHYMHKIKAFLLFIPETYTHPSSIIKF